MSSFALCTSLYEAGRPYLNDWIEGAIAAAARGDCRCIAAVDDLADAEAALAPLARRMPCTLVQARAGATHAEVRGAMLAAARNSGADILVFCDMDDWLIGDALPLHDRALAEADFSYGDLAIPPADGSAWEDSFFDGCAVPEWTIRAEQIADRNWLGLSNTAVRREALVEEAVRIPADVIAADWWLFTELLARGKVGRQTAGAVAEYRLHAGNLLGPRADPSPAAVRRRAEIVRRHYAARAGDPVLDQRRAAVNRLIEALAEPDEALQADLAAACAAPGVWHEDIARLAAGAANTGRAASVSLPSYLPPEQVVTRDGLVRDLSEAGIEPGDTVMVHVSLSSVGFVVGGARTVLDALHDAVGPEGTLMMPAFSGELTNPATWFKPPVPEPLWGVIRDQMPPFDPARTPSSGVGVIAELFRTEEGVLRSAHPVSSLAAKGPQAAALVADHPLDQRFGPASPIGRLCDLGGKVLAIGAPHESLTVLHLTTYRLDLGEPVEQASPVLDGGRKRWVRYQDRTFEWKWFDACVRHLIDRGIARASRIGGARGILMRADEAVEAATAWRQAVACKARRCA